MITEKELDLDLLSVQEARRLVARAKEAQARLAVMDEGQVEKILAAVAGAGERAAARLARLAVEETGFGRYEDKVFKNRYASSFVFRSLQGMQTVGVLWHDRAAGVLAVAEPMGVVAALVPVTAPTATVLFQSLIALKARDAIVFSPHPRAVRSSLAAAETVREALAQAGAPVDLVSCLAHASMHGTGELMGHRDVALILGMGGAGMIKAAYGAGKPAIAVGPGNVPAYVDRSVRDLAEAARCVIESKTFDYGTPCASEQSLVVDGPVLERLQGELRRQGAHFLAEEEKQALRRAVQSGGAPNPAVVGQSPQRLAELAGFRVPPACRVLVAELAEVGPAEPLSAEILTTLLGLYRVDGWRAGLQRCNQLLEYGGLGHTCVLHAEAPEVVAGFATGARAFRVVVNAPSATGAIGYATGLEPSLMLGTGTWGGGISSDNITARHLVNIRRVAYKRRDGTGAGANQLL